MKEFSFKWVSRMFANAISLWGLSLSIIQLLYSRDFSICLSVAKDSLLTSLVTRRLSPSHQGTCSIKGSIYFEVRESWFPTPRLLHVHTNQMNTGILKWCGCQHLCTSNTEWMSQLLITLEASGICVTHFMFPLLPFQHLTSWASSSKTQPLSSGS